jgi:leucyl aminopeptidase
LKKYENLSKNKIVKSYLEDPVSALFEDRDIEILKILEAIQKAIIKHEITLKEEKRSRIMNELFNLKKDFFEEFLTKRREVNSRLSEITTLIENSQILKDIAELEKSIAESKSLLQEKTLTYEKMNKDIKTFSPENLIDELEKELNEKLKIDIRII